MTLEEHEEMESQPKVIFEITLTKTIIEKKTVHIAISSKSTIKKEI